MSGRCPSREPMVPSVGAVAPRRTVPALRCLAGAGLLAALLVVTPGAAGAAVLAGTRSCEVAPADSVWRTPIASLPVASDSAAMIAAIGASAPLHPDFGSGLWDGGPIGIPYNVVPHTQRQGPRLVPLRLAVRPRRLPDPARTRRSRAGRARRATATSCSSTRPRASTTSSTTRGPSPHSVNWTAGSGAVFNLRLRRAASRRLDLRGRRGARDPAGARAPRGGRERGHRPRDPRDGARDRRALHLARAPRGRRRRRLAAADGAAAAPQGVRRHRGVPEGRPDHPPGAQDLRDDRGGQRLALVPLRACRRPGGTTTSCTSSTGSSARTSRSSTSRASRSRRTRRARTRLGATAAAARATPPQGPAEPRALRPACGGATPREQPAAVQELDLVGAVDARDERRRAEPDRPGDEDAGGDDARSRRRPGRGGTTRRRATRRGPPRRTG